MSILTNQKRQKKRLAMVEKLIEQFEDEHIKKRLIYLYKLSILEEDQDKMDKDSLKSFFEFLNRLSRYGMKLEKPELTLTPNGTIWADWGQLLSIHFVNNEENSFISYTPKKDGSGENEEVLMKDVKSIVDIVRVQKQKYSWIIKKQKH